MSLRTSAPGDAASAAPARYIGLIAVVIFVMSAATPLTVYIGIITNGFGLTGLIGIPVAFIAMAVILSLFVPGFTAMAPMIGNPGSFVGYVAQLGRPIGVGAAGWGLIAYNALQVGLYGFIGVVGAPLLDGRGWSVPWWVVALAAWALVAVLGHRSPKENSLFVGVLLLGEILVVAVASVTNVLDPFAGVVSTDALNPLSLADPKAGAAFALALIGFIGIEAAVVYAKDVRNPHRTIPAAMYTTILLTAVLYAGAAWALTVTLGPANTVGAAQAHGSQLVLDLALKHLGPDFVAGMNLLMLSSGLAAAISFHNAVARYCLSLGKERVLFAWFDRTNPKTGAPVSASRAQSLLGLIVIVGFALLGWDPERYLFYWGGGIGALGVLLLITAAAVAVVHFFAADPERRASRPWWWWIAPVLSVLALGWVLAQVWVNFHHLLGEPDDAFVVRAVPPAFIAVAVAGAAFALWLRHARPGIYSAIGLGAQAATARPIVMDETVR